MNLVDELGVHYMQNRFAECMFFDEKKRPCYINVENRWPSGMVRTTAVLGTVAKPVLDHGETPYEFFTDLSVFAVPPLGWRQAAQGRYLVHLRRNNRTYHRGVAPSVITRWLSPASQYLVSTGNISADHYTRVSSTIAMVMSPEYTPLKEGLAAMRKGEIMSFAMSPTVAIIPDVNDSQAIYFNTNRVGTVTADGAIICPNSAIQSLFEEAQQ